MNIRNLGRKTRFALLMFCIGFFSTISVNAQSQGQAQGDVIQLNDNKDSVITGTIKEATENFLIIDSNGKDMKIILDDVNVNAPADDVFTPGMLVSIDGEITGEDFGVPLVEAKSVTATQAPPEAVQ